MSNRWQWWLEEKRAADEGRRWFDAEMALSFERRLARDGRSILDVRAELLEALRDRLVAVAKRPPWTVTVDVGDINRPDPRPLMRGGVMLTHLPWGLLSKPTERCVVGVHEPTQTIVPVPTPPSSPDPQISPLGLLFCVHEFED